MGSIKRFVQVSLALAAAAVCSPAVAWQTDTEAVDRAAIATVNQHAEVAYLVDSAGWSVYLFKADAGAKGSNCYDCAKMWPPVLTDGNPIAMGMAKADMLGTINRKNGAIQVT